MSILACRETFKRRSVNSTEITKELTRSYFVYTNDLLITPIQVEEANDPNGDRIPSIGDVHIDYPYSTVERVESTQDSDNPFLWEVIVSYTNRDTNTNPLLRPIEITFDIVPYQVPMVEALLLPDLLNGDLTPIVNSAGDPFDPPPMTEEYMLDITITRNEATYPEPLARTMYNKINSETFLGRFAQGLVRHTGIAGQRIYEDPYTYYRLSYKFQVKFDGWTLKLLDAGYRQLVIRPGLGTHKEEITVLGSQISSPWPLDGQGNALPGGVSLDLLVYREYLKHTYADFGQFNFGDL